MSRTILYAFQKIFIFFLLGSTQNLPKGKIILPWLFIGWMFDSESSSLISLWYFVYYIYSFLYNTVCSIDLK